jgi:excinuclease UvrABC helicase subunit UvrB
MNKMEKKYYKKISDLQRAISQKVTICEIVRRKDETIFVFPEYEKDVRFKLEFICDKIPSYYRFENKTNKELKTITLLHVLNF